MKHLIPTTHAHYASHTRSRKKQPRAFWDSKNSYKYWDGNAIHIHFVSSDKKKKLTNFGIHLIPKLDSDIYVKSLTLLLVILFYFLFPFKHIVHALDDAEVCVSHSVRSSNEERWLLVRCLLCKKSSIVLLMMIPRNQTCKTIKSFCRWVSPFFDTNICDQMRCSDSTWFCCAKLCAKHASFWI